MKNIEHSRHTLAHLLAAAVQELYPDAKPTIGPAIDTGFYYDFDFGSNKINEEVLASLEAKMTELLPRWEKFEHKVVAPAEAREYFKNNAYKLELLSDIQNAGEEITFYTCSGFTDLCRGGHSEHPNQEIDPQSFKLDRIAGAYWRGDEKNPMLTRIYGLAFTTQKELAAYLLQREEARKRDHKKLGRELGLFTFSELVGPGLPLWTPKGTLLRETLNDFVWELRSAQGYQKVTIPHITKKELYETSGHWAKYGEDLFKIHTREDHLFAMKPMNCPHHTQIFDAEPRSYRTMPQRYCETSMVYRDEQSGELSGLSRVLSITQDDAHVFCRENQIEQEVGIVWNIIKTFYKTFGFELRVRLSRRDPKSPEKYLGSSETWDKAEDTLREFIKSQEHEWVDGVGEAAFYGPKIDFIAYDSIGREWQVATIQLDFVQPENFNLYCTNEKGEKERVVMIHCAIMGSLERFLSIIIEHYAGAFPTWLSPVQVKVLPIADAHQDFAHAKLAALKASGIRAELDESSETLGKKIRQAKLEKTPYILVIGDQEVAANLATLESRDQGKIGQLSLEEIIVRLTDEIEKRK